MTNDNSNNQETLVAEAKLATPGMLITWDAGDGSEPCTLIVSKIKRITAQGLPISELVVVDEAEGLLYHVALAAWWDTFEGLTIKEIEYLDAAGIVETMEDLLGL